jgi:7-carboxy-7-deazaguanine synthase
VCTEERIDETLVVTEVFQSIQGESTWAGLPCVFVRLTGCNLRCTWCDTAYALHGGTEKTVGDLVARCDSFDCDLVEITGGEPLVQQACPAFAACLLDRGKTVLCETNGTLPIDRLPAEVVKIMDLKCPGSGECHKNDWANVARLSARDEVKFAIKNRADYEWSRAATRKHDLPARCNAVLFAPVFGELEPKQLVEWILEDRLDVRFQLQLHKLVWGPDAKGV